MSAAVAAVSAAAVRAVASAAETAVAAVSATAVASGAAARGGVRGTAAVRHRRSVGATVATAEISAVVATAVASGACLSGRVRRAGVVRNGGSVGRCAAVVSAIVSAVAAAAVVSAVRSWSAAMVVVRRTVVMCGRCGIVVCWAVVVCCRSRVVVCGTVVVCHAVVMSGSRGVVYVVHRAVVVRVVCPQMRVVVGAVVAHGVRGSHPRSVNGHCPCETHVHHRGVESKQTCHRNGITAIVYPNVVQIHRSGNHLVGADVVTVNPHFVAQSGGFFPDIRGIDIVPVVGIVGVVY